MERRWEIGQCQLRRGRGVGCRIDRIDDHRDCGTAVDKPNLFTQDVDRRVETIEEAEHDVLGDLIDPLGLSSVGAHPDDSAS